MIKRRFYKFEHAEKDDASDPSSSSSDSESELEAEAIEESETDAKPEVKEEVESGSTSSGYKSEDSSGNEIDVNSSGMPFYEDDAETGKERETLTDGDFSGKNGLKLLERKSKVVDDKELSPSEFPSYIFKCKSVFKCKICPRIVCLNEDTLRTHLKSKRHSRSEKLLSEGRLKSMLNSDGEIEDQETAAEMHARILAIAEQNPKKKNEGRKRQKKRSKNKKMRDNTNPEKRTLTKSPAKKRRKDEN
ncbi:C2H2 type zf-met: zinc-finger protein [Quillaja saponaria]|uniref:C2H2 type zf-met: zinc-finger protein n=1 Tax=Quillaja saponaria TaxID=32244 RepID=A0AAD7Q6H9_QUISA|nr:C2H2 type zf-met: zinc-finger protein [Quillaja saponaria]